MGLLWPSFPVVLLRRLWACFKEIKFCSTETDSTLLPYQWNKFLLQENHPEWWEVAQSPHVIVKGVHKVLFISNLQSREHTVKWLPNAQLSFPSDSQEVWWESSVQRALCKASPVSGVALIFFFFPPGQLPLAFHMCGLFPHLFPPDCKRLCPSPVCIPMRWFWIPPLLFPL